MFTSAGCIFDSAEYRQLTNETNKYYFCIEVMGLPWNLQSPPKAKLRFRRPSAIISHLKPGDRVKFLVHPDGTVVLLPKIPVSALRGMLKSRRAPVTIDEMREPPLPVPSDPPARAAKMIGLDTPTSWSATLVQDNPVQSPKATELIERRLTEQNPGLISVIALAETVMGFGARLPTHGP